MVLKKYRVLKTFVGAYPCDAELADHIQREKITGKQGEMLTVERGYKKFKALIHVERETSKEELRHAEQDKARAALIGKEYEPPFQTNADGQTVTVLTEGDEFIELPSAYVIDNKLIERGLIEEIAKPAKARTQ